MGDSPVITDFRQRFAYARDADVTLYDITIRIPNVIHIEPRGSGISARDSDGTDVSDAVKGLAECIDTSIIYSPSLGEFSAPVRKGNILILPISSRIPEIQKGDIIVIPHLSRLDAPQQIVETLLTIKEKRYDAVVYAPGCGIPWRVALLAYLGVDLTDTAGIPLPRGMRYTADGLIPDDSSISDLAGELRREIITIRHALAEGTLRELVERRSLVEPWMMAALRYSDIKEYEKMEYHYPVCSRVNASSREALNRPDVRRFRERVITRYEKPPFSDVLLLLPCSAKKPYSQSRTHQIINEIIRSVNATSRVHRVVVTSPLGVVPEELDILPPASSYDIPVIGIWDENEASMITSCLEAYLRKNKYAYIINHATDDIPSLRELSNETTLEGHPLSERSLENLKTRLQRYTGDNDRSMLKVWRWKAVSRFQFGVSLEIDAVRTIRDTAHLYSKGELVGFSRSSFIIPSFAGAAQMMEKRVHLVEIGDFPLRGDIFAPGVTSTTQDFRIGDQVIAHAGGHPRAIGVAAMTPREMVELDRGIAIRVHTRIK